MDDDDETEFEDDEAELSDDIVSAAYVMQAAVKVVMNLLIDLEANDRVYACSNLICLQYLSAT